MITAGITAYFGLVTGYFSSKAIIFINWMTGMHIYEYSHIYALFSWYEIRVKQKKIWQHYGLSITGLSGSQKNCKKNQQNYVNLESTQAIHNTFTLQKYVAR